MFYCLWVLVAMETHFPLYKLKYQYFEEKKNFQNIDTLELLHGIVFPWQPTPIGNKTSFY